MRRIILFCGIVLSVLIGCGRTEKGTTAPAPERGLPDTLRVGTLYSPSSYFIYRDEPMGYDYDMARKFAESHNMEFSLVVAGNIGQLVEKLDSGKIDLIAYDVPKTAEYKDKVLHCGQEMINSQVLVQQASDSALRDVTDLIGRTVTVQHNTRFQHRLENLNAELGGGIIIDSLQRDTLVRADMIEMVHNGEVDYTIVDSETATRLGSYYPDLDMELKVSLDQASSWAVNPKDKKLAEAVDKWWERQETSEETTELYYHYFAARKELFDDRNIMNAPVLGNGKISIYDPHFKQFAPIVGWDWRLLAALGWTESHFTPTIRSWAGACGVMQLMPRTAAQYGIRGTDIFNPKKNIEGGAKLLSSLEKSFAGIKDERQRRKFVLASYNAGLGHILDARALARKLGYNPDVWEGNVRTCVQLKSQPKYYNDPVVKHGYVNSKETVEFVDKVERLYTRYRTLAEA